MGLLICDKVCRAVASSIDRFTCWRAHGFKPFGRIDSKNRVVVP
jgi:hypothetical protein